MLDKNTKQKLKRIWCERLVIGAFASVALISFAVKVPTVYSHMQKQTSMQEQVEQDKLALGGGWILRSDESILVQNMAKEYLELWQTKQEGKFEQGKPVVVEILAVGFGWQKQDQLRILIKQSREQFTNGCTTSDWRICIMTSDREKTKQKQKQKQVQLRILTGQGQELATRMLGEEHKIVQPIIYIIDRIEKENENNKQIKELARMEQELQKELRILGASLFCLIIMLLLLKQRNKVSLAGQLIIIIPEECVAELEALHQQIKSEKHSIFAIKTIMLWNLLHLFWALYIQINIENLWLPKGKGNKKIDK